jgi:aspartate/methionine/tyrosine aminotransferase
VFSEMTLRVSRRGQVPPFIAMDMYRAATQREASGSDVIHLELGQPGSAAPKAVRERAREALANARIGYTDSLGITALREAIATHYQAQYGALVEPAEVVVTTGSSAAFQLAFLAAFEAGDRVALAVPGYPAYRNILAALGIEPVMIAVNQNTHYQPTPELLAQAGPLDGLIIASPANPTGTMIAADDLTGLTEYCGRHDIRLVSDEIYHGITYDYEAMTARSAGHDAIIVNSFSKYYSMTGWRLGWMLAPPDLFRSIECLAAIPAFECRPELDRHVARYRANRDLLIEALKAAGLWHFAPADGAFYLYLDVSSLTRDSEEFCRQLLAETGVAITPGWDFDPIGGGGWVRLSYAGPAEDIVEACRRLTAWLPRAAES